MAQVLQTRAIITNQSIANDIDDPLKELNENVKQMQTKDPSLVPEGI